MARYRIEYKENKDDFPQTFAYYTKAPSARSALIDFRRTFSIDEAEIVEIAKVIDIDEETLRG